jgi:hypothetical protein
VTLYKEQWVKLLDMADLLKQTLRDARPAEQAALAVGASPSKSL